jgi:ABC-2 type transport system ATP-binding protein
MGTRGGMGQVLRASGITQRFGERVVLDGVDLDVPAGSVIGLLGPNGAGKTTLMRILFGVLAPDSGTVEWNGRPATDADRRSWGYMPQERGLYRDMRVLDLLVWIARLHGLDRKAGETRSLRLLEQLDLDARANDKISNLSGGMAQRIQLAAAMVHGPELLVLDEPFAGLDPVAVSFLSDVIREHTRAGRNLLFSSHQLDLVEDLCETITLINRGRVVLHGDVQQLKAASPNRWLRVNVPVDPSWLDPAAASIGTVDASGTRMRLNPGADPAAVLDAVRARAHTTDFGVVAPSLSELFLEAAGVHPDSLDESEFETERGDGARARAEREELQR